MKLSGKIVKIVDETYKNKEGEEKHKKTIIVHEISNDQYKDESVFELYGDKADNFQLKENQIVVISFGFKVDSREYQGKTYYTQKLIFYRAEVV